MANKTAQEIKQIAEETNRALGEAEANNAKSAGASGGGAGSHPGRRHWVPVAEAPREREG